MRRFSLPLLSLLFILAASLVQAQQQSLSARDYLKLGNTRFSKGDMEGAMADYTKSIELDPQLAEAHLNRGKARRAKGNLDGAIDDYEAAIQLDPQMTSNNR